MNLLQIILFPLGLVWGIIAQIKRTLYELLSLRSKGHLPNVVVGNINVGGTGKTPTLIWLYNELIELGLASQQIGVLSRGYRRKTKGFAWVNYSSQSNEVGDEPLEIATALSRYSPQDQIKIAVCENRVLGIEKMKNDCPSLSLVLLDDGFQHLRLQHDLGIILCDYRKPFTTDWPLPSGRLREFPWASNSAEVILVTNCPKDLSQEQSEAFKLKLGKQMNRWMWLSRIVTPNKPANWKENVAFFCTTTSTPLNAIDQVGLSPDSPVYLITGIANPMRVSDNLSGYQIIQHDKFADHYRFSKGDIEQIQQKFYNLQKTYPALALITTRKDYMRIQSIWPKNLPLFIISSQIEPLLDSDKKITQILNTFIHEQKIA